MSFKNYLYFYFKKMPIITIILTAIVTKGGIIGAIFSSIIRFFLVLVFYMPLANTILSIICYPVYALFRKKNIDTDTSKDNSLKYVISLSIIWFYSFLIGTFILGMLNVISPDSTQKLLYETNNIKASFYYLMGDDPTFWIYALFIFLTFVTALPKLLTAFTDKNFALILLMSTITSLNFVYYNYILWIFVSSITAIIVDYFYQKEQCTDINLNDIPKKYFIYYIISFLITFITIFLVYNTMNIINFLPLFLANLLLNIKIVMSKINIVTLIPNIIFIILMIDVIKNHLPKDKDKKENIDIVD